jgi:flagellar hook-associated protein FlgK
MGTNIDDIASLVQGLTLRGNPLSFPQETIQGLDQLVSTINARARLVEALTDDANHSFDPSISDVCSLYKQIKKLTEITLNLMITVGKLTELTEISISRQFTSLSNQRASLATRSL